MLFDNVKEGSLGHTIVKGTPGRDGFEAWRMFHLQIYQLLDTPASEFEGEITPIAKLAVLRRTYYRGWPTSRQHASATRNTPEPIT